MDALLEWPSGPVRFVDTAGMRRQTRVSGVEYYGFVRATRAIERADVVVVVIEAPEGFTSEDKKIVVRVLDAGRGLLIAANKWDLVEEKDRTFKRPRRGGDALRQRDHHADVGHARDRVFTAFPPLLLDVRERWAHRVSTAKVNEVLQQAQGEHPTPRNAGNLHYATQVGSGPPTFVIFGGSREPDPSYQRYLENRLRRTFDYDGVPDPADVPAPDARSEARWETSLVCIRPGGRTPQPARAGVRARPLDTMQVAGRGAAW